MSNFKIEEYIKRHITSQPKYIEIPDGKKKVKITIKEDIDSNDVHDAIDTIVANVLEQDYTYEAIDLMRGYYILKLFTDIPIPTLAIDGEGEEYPDYEKCNMFIEATGLDYYLMEQSPIVKFYISMLDKNVWRKLEYKKSLTSLLPFNDLLTALGEFYEILDNLNDVVNAEENLDIAKLSNELEELNKNFKDLAPGVLEVSNKNKTNKASIDLVK